jgi:signal recognition particle subunit SRP54
MFESLSDRLGSVVSKLRNRGRLTEADVDETLGEISATLLDCDSTLDGIQVRMEAWGWQPETT